MSFNVQTTRVLIVEPAGTIRQMICDVIKDLGFSAVVNVASCKEALNYIEVDPIDWLITPLMPSGPVNAIHLLKLCTEHARLKTMRCSLLLDDSEKDYLPLAFELGAMSWHHKTYSRDSLFADFKRLLQILASNSWNPCLAAAEYLRECLLEKRQYSALLELESDLIALFGVRPDRLLHLAEAQALSGKLDDAFCNIRGAEILDNSLRVEASQLKQKYFPQDTAESRHRGSANILKIRTCAIIEPDVIVRDTMQNLLVSAGVPEVVCFGDGEAMIDWCASNEEPDLIIQEWRVPKIAGPLLLQRIRQRGFVNVPVVIASSLIKPSEIPLVREMGVAHVIPKPFDHQSFFQAIIWALQQNRCPNEQRSLERKIRALLASGKNGEAERLKAQYQADPRIPEGHKKMIEAEFEFQHGRFQSARDLGIEALRLNGDSIFLLNLIGKSLIKLGDYGTALKFLEKAHAMAPANISRLCQIAEAHMEMGAHDTATAFSENAIALDSGNELAIEMSCNVAIAAGDSSRAKKLMKDLESVTKVISFMNSRAVALIRCMRFDEGIKIYHKTLEALPEEWSDTHAIVSYNLALAYARYGELDQAVGCLKSAGKTNDQGLREKAASLLRRVETSLKTGTSLALYSDSLPALPTRAEPSPNQAAPAASEVRPLTLATSDIVKGDVCCHLIFKSPLEHSPECMSLLDRAPRYVERSSIERATQHFLPVAAGGK